MRRRGLLGVLASGLAGASAGCVGGGGGGGDGTTTETTTATTTTERTTAATTTGTTTATTTATTTTEGPVASAISLARENLRAATTDLSPSPTPTQGQQSMSSFEPDPYRDRIAAARNSLDEAESSGPNDDQQATIERLRAIASFVESYVEFLVPVKRATESFQAANDSRISGQYDAAIESLNATNSHLEEAQSRLEAVRTRSSEVGNYLEVGAAPYDGALQDLRGEPSEWSRRFNVFTLLVEGEIRLVEALRSYTGAVAAYESGEYAAAVDGFSTAQSSADEAKTRFDEVVQRSLTTSIGVAPATLSCRAGAVRAAAGNYADAATAARDGNQDEADTARGYAEDAFGRDC